MSKSPRKFFEPLAIGAPAPYRELPVRVERMIHFVPPHLEKVRAKIGETIPKADVILGNLEDAIPADAKEAARKGFIEMGLAHDYGSTGLWTRVNCLNSPWLLDDVTEIVGAIGNKLDVIMLPKVEGPWDIHYLDQLLAQLEARHGVTKPILIHAILETAEGVKNVEEIALASPRMHGMSLGPADLAASRAMKTTRVGGGHPEYKVLADPGADAAPSARSISRTSGITPSPRWSTPAPRPASRAFMARSATSPTSPPAKSSSATPSLWAAPAPGRCIPTRSPSRRRCSRPIPRKWLSRRKILEAMPDGSGVAMIDGKMQDDATWKQAKVMVDCARQVAAKDPGLRRALRLLTLRSALRPPLRPDTAAGRAQFDSNLPSCETLFASAQPDGAIDDETARGEIRHWRNRQTPQISRSAA